MGWQSVSIPIAGRKAVGPHTVRVRFDIEVFSSSADTSPGRTQAFRDYPLTVVGSAEPLVQAVEDEGLRKQVVSALRPTVMRQRGTMSGGVSMWARPIAAPNSSPANAGAIVGGSWSIFIEVEGVRLPAGKFKFGWRAAGDIFQASVWENPGKMPDNATQCRVVLVPDERFGAQREAIGMMPSGEIVIDDVPIN